MSIMERNDRIFVLETSYTVKTNVMVTLIDLPKPYISQSFCFL